MYILHITTEERTYYFSGIVAEISPGKFHIWLDITDERDFATQYRDYKSAQIIAEVLMRDKLLTSNITVEDA